MVVGEVEIRGASYMTLNLDIDRLAGPGRPRRVLQAELVRELGEPDFALLAATPRGVTSPPIKRISERHHSLARLLAAGTPEAEAALITGYSASRISILKQSPAFEELVALYHAEVQREFTTTYEHMAGLSKDAVVELRDRLEDDAEKFSNRELLSISTELSDRAADAGDGGGRAPVRIELVGPDEEPVGADS